MKSVTEHIKWEWEKFTLDMLCTSKQNIFSKSNEIENKRFIYNVISEREEKFEDKETAIICASDCVIDTIYNKIFIEEKQERLSPEKILEELHRFCR
jgi:hypothetical protein